jgi:hypothetical protein
MAKRPSEDIPIGADAWIAFIPIDGRQHAAAEIDDLLVPLFPLFDRLETHCAAGCCGLSAFDFEADAVDTAVRELDPAHLRRALHEVADAIARLPQSVVMSRRLNNYLHRETLLPLLRHLSSRLRE